MKRNLTEKQAAVGKMIAAVKAGKRQFANPQTKAEKMWTRQLERVFEDLQDIAADLGLEQDLTFDPQVETRTLAEKRAKKSVVLDLIRLIKRVLKRR